MAIAYICGGCKKKFKVKEYIRLDVSENENISDPQGRKCNSCGATIRNEDKTCGM